MCFDHWQRHANPRAKPESKANFSSNTCLCLPKNEKVDKHKQFESRIISELNKMLSYRRETALQGALGV